MQSEDDINKIIQDRDTTVPFEEIAQRKGGVFIVRLVDEGTMDHAVTIPTEEGVIIDPEEEQAITLSAETSKSVVVREQGSSGFGSLEA